MSGKGILYICRKQFGYSIDNYYHCKYLADDFNITYLSPDVGWRKIAIDGVVPVYVKFKRNRIINNALFYLKGINLIRKGRYDIIILNRSPFFFLFKLFNSKQKFIYDIRSGTVYPSALKRFIYTFFIKFDLLFYKHVSIISNSLAKRLKIKNYHVLPLGADDYKLPPKDFSELSLVYTGTFTNRNIVETVEGFALFKKQCPNKLKCSYHLYGFGDTESEAQINLSIAKNQLHDQVVMHGRYHIESLASILNKHNIGVSYIPVTPYFDVQPPTKTFEYLLAGMPVLATETHENRVVINENNGVTCKDTPYAFSKALIRIIENIQCGKYNSAEIAKASAVYSWEYIVKNILKKYIDTLLQEKQ